MNTLVAVRDLVIHRGKNIVLTVDKLDVKENEVLAVIGPNGAGKTTLLLALARLLDPEKGEVLFRDRPVKSMKALAYRRHIAVVLQEPLLLDTSVISNVTMGLRFRGVSKAEINQRSDEWLQQLGIAHLRDRRASGLSGGEAQRVSLARAFVLQPELLLLDEPFSGLDAPTRSRLLIDLQTVLNDTNITTVFITHDLNEALLLGDRVAVLLDGRLRQTDSPEKVFSMPADTDVAAFVGVETVIPGRVITCCEGQVTIDANGLQLEAIGEVEAGRKVFLCLRPEDITLWQQEGISVSSARNRLNGRIQRMLPQGPLVRVELDCGFSLTALITRSSAREMELSVGANVMASFKASAIHLIPR